MPQDSNIIHGLAKTGQVSAFNDLQHLVFNFEEVLKRFCIPIQPGSELEAACCSVLEVLGKYQDSGIRNPQEDI